MWRVECRVEWSGLFWCSVHYNFKLPVTTAITTLCAHRQAVLLQLTQHGIFPARVYLSTPFNYRCIQLHAPHRYKPSPTRLHYRIRISANAGLPTSRTTHLAALCEDSSERVCPGRESMRMRSVALWCGERESVWTEYRHRHRRRGGRGRVNVPAGQPAIRARTPAAF